jgi:sugar phosphate isomerase/epimerase
MKIGIVAESTGLPLRQALAAAARIGAAGVQIDSAGDLSPDHLSETGRRELRNHLRTYNLALTSLNAPLRRGIDIADDQQARIEHIRKVMTLAYDLGTRLAIIPCPRIPDDTEVSRAQLLREALLALGTHGDRIGTTLALKIGLDPGDKVRDYLAGFDVGSLGVNYDPANLLLNGHDPVQNLTPLRDRIAHTHARDARAATISRVAQEVPLGAGDVDWLSYVATLGALEYRGWLVVERQTGNRRLADVEAGVQFLKRLIIPS